MPQSFDKVPEHIDEMITRAIGKWHQPLAHAGVTVDALFCTEYDKDSGEMIPTLKHGGYPAAATIKPTSLKERALGVADALLVIDEFVWGESTEAQQMALLDHELTHLEVCCDGGGSLVVNDGKVIGEVKKDDLGRPKLRTRRHDVVLGGFRTVMRRHRANSIEALQIAACCDESGQLRWEFSGNSKPQLVAAE